MVYAYFVVEGLPKAAPRPRVTRNGTFMPKTDKDWRQAVQVAARPHRPSEPIATATAVDVEFFLLPTKKADPAAGAIGKPDLDNLAKSVLDALTADGWFSDDCVVVDLRLRKSYAIGRGVGATVEIHAV